MLRIVLLIIISTPLVTLPSSDRFTSCLPAGVTLKSEVVDDLSLVGPGNQSESSATKQNQKPKKLKSALTELNAQCKKGKLTNRTGKEIRIVQLIGCWGNPPDDYQEQMDRQRREIEELRKKYIVIEVPCTSNRTIARL
jgi:hypothetical protein